MKLIYQCDFCGEKFKNDEKTARVHEADCEAKRYNIGDRVEVFYLSDAGESKWLKGTITYKFCNIENPLVLIVRMDEQLYKYTDTLHSGHDMRVPNDGAPSISKNVRRFVSRLKI